MERILENLKQEARESWSGETGEKRAKDLETYLRAKLKEYSDALGIPELTILKSWEEDRNYSAINYYQPANQPAIKNAYVFETISDYFKSIGNEGFRCPLCGNKSTDPYECNSGAVVSEGDNGQAIKCDWKVYGLFKDLNKGVFVFIKDIVKGQLIFRPIAWEEEKTESEA